MRLRSSDIPSPRVDCTSAEKMSNSKTHSEDDVPIRYISRVTYVDGKRQLMTGIMRKQPTDSSRRKAHVRLPAMKMNAGESKSECSSGKRARVTVGDDVRKKSHTERTEAGLRVPSDNMEKGIENSGRNGGNACPEADLTRVKSSEGGTGKCEGCGAKSRFIRHVIQIFEDEEKYIDGLRDKHDNILPEPQKVVGSVKGIECESEHLVQNSKEGKRTEKAECEANAGTDRWQLQGEIARLKHANLALLTEKAQCEANAVTDRWRLQGEITGLKQANIEVSAEKARAESKSVDEKLRSKLEIEDLEKKFEVERDTFRSNSERIRMEIERKNSNQLAKEREKNLCKMCFASPRDVILLPCLHFQYCNECLRTHWKQKKECPTCRGKIHGFLELFI